LHDLELSSKNYHFERISIQWRFLSVIILKKGDRRNNPDRRKQRFIDPLFNTDSTFLAGFIAKYKRQDANLTFSYLPDAIYRGTMDF